MVVKEIIHHNEEIKIGTEDLKEPAMNQELETSLELVYIVLYCPKYMFKFIYHWRSS